MALKTGFDFNEEDKNDFSEELKNGFGETAKKSTG